jgi:adenylate kinase
MIIALTGTPCTGKSTVCRHLEEDYKIIDLNKLIQKEGLHTGLDEQRNSLIADLDAIQDRVDEILKDETATVIIEGHFSHLLKGIDAVIVLRTRPEVLVGRLLARGYSPEKVQENMEAEALDVILIEAVELNDKVYEVENIAAFPEDIGLEIELLIELIKADDPEQLKKYIPGRFDWNKEVFL